LPFWPQAAIQISSRVFSYHIRFSVLMSIARVIVCRSLGQRCLALQTTKILRLTYLPYRRTHYTEHGHGHEHSHAHAHLMQTLTESG
jgi:hypothetical protein